MDLYTEEPRRASCRLTLVLLRFRRVQTAACIVRKMEAPARGLERS